MSNISGPRRLIKDEIIRQGESKECIFVTLPGQNKPSDYNFVFEFSKVTQDGENYLFENIIRLNYGPVITVKYRIVKLGYNVDSTEYQSSEDSVIARFENISNIKAIRLRIISQSPSPNLEYALYISPSLTGLGYLTIRKFTELDVKTQST